MAILSIGYRYKIDVTFMNSENSATSDPHRLVII